MTSTAPIPDDELELDEELLDDDEVLEELLDEDELLDEELLDEELLDDELLDEELLDDELLEDELDEDDELLPVPDCPPQATRLNKTSADKNRFLIMNSPLITLIRT